MDSQTLAKMQERFGHGLRATYEMITDLEKARAAFETLVDDMADVCLLMTNTGTCIWGNQAAADLLGVDPEDIPRLDLAVALRPKDWLTMCDQLRMVRDFADKPDPFAFAIGEGERSREFSWYLRPFRGVMTKLGTLVVAIGRDVTELLREHTEMVRLETELVTANIVQEAFFPAANIDLPRLAIASFHRPAERCSGDWWGRFSLGPGLELVCIGDVTGHGAAAAFLTAVAHATCTTLAQLIADGAHAPVSSPSEVLKLLSGVMTTSRHESQLMTMFAAVLDLKAGVVRFANAGHVFPLLLPAQLGDDRIPGDGTRPWLALNQSGCPLGYATIDEYKDREMPLRLGDRIVLYTDGLLENAGPDGTQWGRRRFNNSLVMHATQSAATLREAIIDAAKSHYAATPLTDDITFAIVELVA